MRSPILSTRSHCALTALTLERAWPRAANHDFCDTRSRHEVRRRTLLGGFTAIALLLSLWQFGSATWIHAKAILAQHLIEQAWSRKLAGELQPRPWPWADTWPVARLHVARLAQTRHVLAGADGRTIAFGPGHVHGTALPGTPGNIAIAAHRDTHFAFLRELHEGDLLELAHGPGPATTYSVRTMSIVDKRDVTALAQGVGGKRLTLITCYPFDAIDPSGPLRYIVTAEEVQTVSPVPARL